MPEFVKLIADPDRTAVFVSRNLVARITCRSGGGALVTMAGGFFNCVCESPEEVARMLSDPSCVWPPREKPEPTKMPSHGAPR